MDNGEKKTPMDAEAKSRIMSAEAKKKNGQIEEGSFPARAQAAADRNDAKEKKKK